MSRNMYPGVCYKCGKWTPAGFGHYERCHGGWRIHCVKCASGRTVNKDDPEVKRALKLRDERRGG